ncbi:ABC transporter substrate-binding protein [Variovorax davisae]|uniref:ABC transporter substrate-binding protein n=1 Tax=Variovorax davisae TaxID=3053515 RepID=UPI0025790EE9|nr:ABC transporter substrate-binding protein [Variovorax sp. J22P271]
MFIGGVAFDVVAVPFVAEAQQPPKVHRIGVLSLATFDNTTLAAVIIEGLARRGHVIGRNLEVEERFADGKVDRLPALAADLVRLRVDLIVAGHTSAIRAARDVTATIPIVMAFSGDDPVQSGFVASLARPGGNVTGVTTVARDLVPKTIELLRDAVSGLVRVAILTNPIRPEHLAYVRIAHAVRPPGMQLHVVEAGRPDQYDAAFAAMALQRAEGVLILGDVMFTRDAGRLAELALRHRLPSVYLYKPFVVAGGLMAYGPDLYQMLDLATQYVDKIIKGADPAELPVQQPTTFKLAINLKTAKALGLTIPPSLRRRADADDVIQ